MSDPILEAVARGWCHPENAHKVMDPDLAVAIAKEVRGAVSTYRGEDDGPNCDPDEAVEVST